MRKVKEVIIISESNISEMENEIQEHISMGYYPSGDVKYNSVINSKDNIQYRFTQTMHLDYTWKEKFLKLIRRN